jgi:dihydroorotate dehydrogenase (NAD+) catalytic subunit
MNMKVNIAGVEWKNPVTVASGTFGSGAEFVDYVDLNKLGAVTTKGVAHVPWSGNATPRVAETYGGMLNSIGLENPGLDVVINEKLPFLKQFDTCVIANICGDSIDEYVKVAYEISRVDNVCALELNISCPNVHGGGIPFGADENTVYEITKRVKEASIKPVYVKLSPNVTDIVKMAKAAERGGADGLSLINTLLGMRIDLKTGRPILYNKKGGFSGPAIKPVAIRMIYDCYEAVNIPIIGMGGIANVDDCIEFLMAGASALGVGTMNLVNPYICKELAEQLPSALEKYGFKDINECIGYAHRK